jgi:hypothetical protein
MFSARMRVLSHPRTDFTPPITTYQVNSKPFNFEPGAPDTVYSIAPSGADILAPVTGYSLEASILDLTVPTVSANIQGGTGFLFPLSVSLSISETGSIYYTLDGSYPTSTSTLYTAPVVLTVSKKLRFVGIDTAGNIGIDKTEIYLP